MSNRLHPATVLTLWGLAVSYLMATADRLPIPVVLLILTGLAVVAGKRFWLLAKRMRYLLLAAMMSFPFLTPGQIIPALPWATYEGAALALHQSMFLLLTAGMVALLMHLLTIQQLVLGLVMAAIPLRCLGLNTARLAVRLGLTIEAITAQSTGGHGVQRQDDFAPYKNLSCYPLEAVSWRGADFAVLATAGFVAIIVWAIRWSTS